MKYVLWLLATLTIATAPASAQKAGVALRNPQATVAAAYARLSTEPLPTRRAVYSAYAADMQADLWALHLSYFLEEQELTPAERAVILEALGVVQGGLLDSFGASPAWRSSYEQFDRHARELGSRRVFDALTRLGGPEMLVSVRTKDLRSDWIPGDDCECSTSDGDFCCFGDCPTSTTPRCHSGRPWCTPTRGCGWLWIWDCDGICGA